MPGRATLDDLAFELPVSLWGVRGTGISVPVGPSLRWIYWVWQLLGSFGWVLVLVIFLADRCRRSLSDRRHTEEEEEEEEESDYGDAWRPVGQAGNGRRPQQQRVPRPTTPGRRTSVHIRGITVSPNATRSNKRYYACRDARAGSIGIYWGWGCFNRWFPTRPLPHQYRGEAEFEDIVLWLLDRGCEPPFQLFLR